MDKERYLTQTVDSITPDVSPTYSYVLCRVLNMKTLILCAGILILCYVVLGLIAGLMPVEGWEFFLDLFIERKPNEFYRVVPSEGGNETFEILVLSFLGFFLIALSRSKFLKNNSK